MGLVTAYWEDEDLKQWIEVGMLIYDASLWSQGIETTALSEWLHYLFVLFDYLPHIGFTTWSGNKGMQILG
ncbi:GNAT family N-acetyltransferase [Vagococcus silagei]|uniref:GNAT family N-acetyltransferase n=1 Tax=Vagococcus silagei TaxID=2508885 RepID=A0A4S3B6A2_9ENTE|nr:GNAT family N-acetyltransferase [Vagococcus silagei]